MQLMRIVHQRTDDRRLVLATDGPVKTKRVTVAHFHPIPRQIPRWRIRRAAPPGFESGGNNATLVAIKSQARARANSLCKVRWKDERHVTLPADLFAP